MSNTAPVVSWNWTELRDVERAVEDLLRSFEVAQLDEDLSERRERDGEAVPGPERLMQADAALRERERLVVAMPHQRDVRLVVHDARQHVVSGDRHRQPFALAKRGAGFVGTPGLCEQHR